MESAGVERGHAKAIAAQMRAAAEAERDDLATGADLAALEARLTWRIVGLVIAANALPVVAIESIAGP